MKVRATITKAERDVLANMVYKDTIEALQAETAVAIIATARFFGLGKKRLEKYLNFLVEVKHGYNVYHKDGVIREMLERDLAELKVSPGFVFEEIEDLKQTEHEIRQMKKHNATSMKEAAEIISKMEEFERYMKGDERYATTVQKLP